MSPLFIALLASYAFIGVLFFILFALADRLDDARRHRSAPIAVIGRDFPVAVVVAGLRGVDVPSAWRKGWRG